MYVSNAPIQNEGRQSWVRCFSWNWILDLFARWMSFGCCEVLGGKVRKLKMVPWNSYRKLAAAAWASVAIVEGSLEVKLPTIWTDEKQSRAEAERRERSEERGVEEKE